MAVHRIVAPVAWRTASKERVRSAIADQESDVLEPFVETDRQVAGLLHCPVAGRVRGDAAEMHPAGAMLDEHQDTYTASSAARCPRAGNRLP